MKQIIIQVIGRLATVAAVCLALDQTQVEAKPNVLFLFADDQCFETIGSLGLTDIDSRAVARSSLARTTWARGAARSAWPADTCS